MIKRQAGFTMVELLITMVIFVFTIAAASSIFVPMLTQFKQQSKIAESNIEGIVGLESLRRDIEQAGFGLPWVIPASVTTATYSEASSNTTGTIPAPDTYNDTSPNTLGPPKAIVSGNDIAGLGGSDYLVIKATSVAVNDAAMRWTYVVAPAGGGAVPVNTWEVSGEDLIANYRAIALIPSRGENNQRILVTSETDNTKYSITFANPFPPAYSPAIQNDLYLVYGVDPGTDLRMPFNRADYYISTTTIPPKCATGTGILMKSVINHVNGNRGTGMPLLDCVANMQVIYRLDTDGNGDIDSETDVLNAFTAQQIREQVREVRVYILAHEGQRDVNYTYPTNPVMVGEFGLGHDFNFNDHGITNWQNYRWKVYRIVVKPNNLRR